MSETFSPEQLVRDTVAVADRRRRAQQATLLASRVAPLCGAGALLTAVVGYFLSWPLTVTAVVSLLLSGALLLALWRVRRPHAVTDAIAAQIDKDASLAGELRSAYWFASADAPDEWTKFHVDRAAGRVRTVTWRDVYPPVAARRAWLATAVLAAAAFVLPVGVPSWPSSLAPVAASVPSSAELAAEIAGLPPELQQQILDILAAVAARKLTVEEALAQIRKLPGFSQLDAEVQQQIEDALNEASRRDEEAAQGSDPDAAPTPGSADVKWARENLASRLANEQAQRAEKDEKNAEGEKPSELGAMTEQAALGEAGEASAGQTNARVPTKDPAASESATGIMAQSGTIGDPGSAFGGKKGNVRYGTVQAQQIAAALKREQIEAVANLDNSNLKNEDKRRRTEQGWSSLRYTRVAGRSTFDRARTAAPRLVPEARRPLLERYFVREPAPTDQPAASPPPAGRRE